MFASLFIFITYTLYHLTMEESRRILTLKNERVLLMEQKWDRILARKPVTTTAAPNTTTTTMDPKPKINVAYAIKKQEELMLRGLSNLQKRQDNKRILEQCK